ncbi:MAG: hypothetical protein ACYTEQ_16090 [Planctomycetota bacterium]|jgi:hypothetical protein
MGADAFAVLHTVEEGPQEFARRFLGSSDFTHGILKEIGQKLNLYTSGKKEDLSQHIAFVAAQDSQTPARKTIISYLFARPKKWVSLKTGWINEFPHLDDPQELVVSPGDEQWYGPITCYGDDVRARWYIHPVFIDHLIALEGDTSSFIPCKIRWLCFARLTRELASLHWRGFSYTDSTQHTAKGQSRFSYWEYVPQLFRKMEKLTRSELHYPDLHRLVLHDIWDKYRGSLGYTWVDRRIRAESSGVNLSAYAGGVLEFDAGGIYNLAQVIRRSVQQEMASKYQVDLPHPNRFDEVILRTLIREYGALSYEFHLEQDSEIAFRAHTYFGHKKGTKTPDSFPHINFHVSHRSALEQLGFLVDHLIAGAHYEDGEPEPLSLF